MEDNMVGCQVEVGKVMMVIIVSAQKPAEGGEVGSQTQNQDIVARSWVCRVK